MTTGTTLILRDPRFAPAPAPAPATQYLRFNVKLDKETSTYTLGIRDVQETDGAIYQCQVQQQRKDMQQEQRQ